MKDVARWYGDLPSGWRESRVAWLATLVNGFPFESELFGDEGYPLVRIRDLNRSESEVRYSGDFVPAAAVRSTDLLIGMDGDFNVGRWNGELPALLNQRVCLLRGDDYTTRYLEYALPMPLKQINELTYATTVKHLSSGQVLQTWVPVPPSASHMRGVVDFLDRETAQIDAVIDAQERLVALLEERRTSVVERAVSMGIRDAPLVSSGSSDIGPIPSHWTTDRLKRLATAASGGTPDTDDQSLWTDDDDGVPWVAIGDMSRHPLVINTAKSVTAAGIAAKRLTVGRRGTVLFAMYASVGEVSMLGVDACWNQALLGLTARHGLMASRFLYYALQAVRPRLPLLYRSNTQHNLNAEQVGNLVLAVPPLKEQGEIVDYLNRATARIETMIAKTEESIALMRERRAALISTAVTGRIDVRTGAEQVERELEEVHA